MIFNMIKNQIINRNPLNKLPFIRQYYTGFAMIAMFHRIEEHSPRGLPSTERLKISPQALELFLENLYSSGYEIISLDQLVEYLNSGICPERQVVLTIDDGYLDNYTNALPIFEKYNAPFTIYLTTSFPDHKAILWWYTLEKLLLENDQLVLGDGSRYLCQNMFLKRLSFSRIRRKIQSIPIMEFTLGVEKLFQYYDIDLFQPVRELALSWEQVKILSEHPLVTIGGHTLNHYAFSQLTEAEIQREVVEANDKILSITGKEVRHFAYPFGGKFEIGRRECDIVKQLGLKSATTTRRGTVFPQHKMHMDCLPRIGIGDNFSLKNIGQMSKHRIVTL